MPPIEDTHFSAPKFLEAVALDNDLQADEDFLEAFDSAEKKLGSEPALPVQYTSLSAGESLPVQYTSLPAGERLPGQLLSKKYNESVSCVKVSMVSK